MTRQNRRTWITTVGCVALALVSASCTKKITAWQLASTNNIALSKKYTQVETGVKETSSSLMVLLYWRIEDPSYYKVLGQCLERHKGDLLTNVKVTTSTYWLVVGAYTVLTVSGDVWRSEDHASAGLVSDTEPYELTMVNDEALLVSVDGSQRLKAYGPNLPKPE